MQNARMIIAVTLALLAGVAVAQNTEVVSFRFLLWEWSMSRILLLTGVLGIGFVLGFIVAKRGTRKKAAQAIKPAKPTPTA